MIHARFHRNPEERALTSGWRAILLGDPCVYCGAPADGLDHIQPRALGGGNGWINRAPACFACDHEKMHRPLMRFLVERHAGAYRPLAPMPARETRVTRTEKSPAPRLTYTLAEQLQALI